MPNPLIHFLYLLSKLLVLSLMCCGNLGTLFVPPHYFLFAPFAKVIQLQVWPMLFERPPYSFNFDSDDYIREVTKTLSASDVVEVLSSCWEPTERTNSAKRATRKMKRCKKRFDVCSLSESANSASDNDEDEAASNFVKITPRVIGVFRNPTELTSLNENKSRVRPCFRYTDSAISESACTIKSQQSIDECQIMKKLSVDEALKIFHNVKVMHRRGSESSSEDNNTFSLSGCVDVDEFRELDELVRHKLADRDICVWKPPLSLSSCDVTVNNENGCCSDGLMTVEDDEVVEYCQVAAEEFKMDMEEALNILYQENYVVSRATQKLIVAITENVGRAARRTVTNSKFFNTKDVDSFQAAIDCYGKDFSRIRMVLPHKTVKELVNYYYESKALRRMCSNGFRKKDD